MQYTYTHTHIKEDALSTQAEKKVQGGAEGGLQL